MNNMITIMPYSSYNQFIKQSWKIEQFMRQGGRNPHIINFVV